MLRQFEILDPRCMLTSIPLLQSLPGAAHVAFLDFDGHVVRNTTWNTEFDAIHAPAFDLDGDPQHWSDQELDRITQIWGQIAEDYRPFDINITTIDPSLENPAIFEEPERAQRILFSTQYDAGEGGTGQRWFASTIHQGFSAYDSWFFDYDNPVWVFATHPNAGTIASHELAHTIGLQHDGEVLDDGSVNEYRGGHGTGETRWSPIMGAGASVLSQWSQGEYPDATNGENDIGLLSHYLGKRPDDYASITALGRVDNRFFQEGAILERSDRDLFSFQIDTESRVLIDVDPWQYGANLDVGISLWGPTALRFSHLDPIVNPVDRLSSSFDLQLAPGDYFLTVEGTGKSPTPTDPGYSDYASLGYYRITGSVDPLMEVLRGDVNADGVVTAADIDALFAQVNAEPFLPRADLNLDQQVDARDVDLLVREVLHTQYGDFDLNGKVEFADFLLLSSVFGQRQTSWADGDANGDRVTDFADFLVLSIFFGST